MKMHWLDIVPVPKGRPRMCRNGHVYTPERTRTFESTVKLLVLRAMRPMEGDLILTVDFYVKRICDLDNLVKSFTDALNGIAYKDDRQIVEIHARRFKNTLKQGINFKLELRERV